MMIEVGDYVRLTRRGDYDGCHGGPKVGDKGRVIAIDDSIECGSYLVRFEQHGEWWTTANRLKKEVRR